MSEVKVEYKVKSKTIVGRLDENKIKVALKDFDFDTLKEGKYQIEIKIDNGEKYLILSL